MCRLISIVIYELCLVQNSNWWSFSKVKAAARETADDEHEAAKQPKKPRKKRGKTNSEKDDKTSASSSKKPKHDQVVPESNAQEAAPKDEQVADVTPVAPELAVVASGGGGQEGADPPKKTTVKKRGAVPADELLNAWKDKEPFFPVHVQI